MNAHTNLDTSVRTSASLCVAGCCRHRVNTCRRRRCLSHCRVAWYVSDAYLRVEQRSESCGGLLLRSATEAAFKGGGNTLSRLSAPPQEQSTFVVPLALSAYGRPRLAQTGVGRPVRHRSRRLGLAPFRLGRGHDVLPRLAKQACCGESAMTRRDRGSACQVPGVQPRLAPCRSDKTLWNVLPNRWHAGGARVSSVVSDCEVVDHAVHACCRGTGAESCDGHVTGRHEIVSGRVFG